MPQRIWLFGAALAATALLLAGCGSVPAPVSSPPRSASATLDHPEPPQAAEHRASAHAHYGVGIIHEMNDRQEDALKEYATAASLDPGNEWLVLEVSRRLLQANKKEEALQLLRNASAQPKASGAVFGRLGLVLGQLGKHDEAVTASREAVRRSPTALAGYHNLFLAYAETKQPEAAGKALDEAAKQTKVSADFLVSLAELYMNLGLQFPAQRTNVNRKALEILDRAAKRSIDSAALKLRLADGFNMLGDSQRAARLYLDVLKAVPDVPLLREQVHAKLAEIYLRSSDHKRAIEQLEAIVKADPTNPQAYYYLGSILLEEKEPAKAAEYFNKTLILSPGFEQAYYDLANAQISADQTASALATLDKARGRFTAGFVLELLTGLAYNRQKAYPEAIRHYTAAEVIARATEPKRLNHGFYFQVGAAYERKGDYEAAEKCFRKSLELSPEFAEAMNYLGYMWAERGTNLVEARQLLEKAVKAEPKNAAYLDSLGWVLFKQNLAEQALPYILKAIELGEEPDATVYDHLGDIYAVLGQKDKAREAWQKSLSVESNEAVKRKLEAP